MSRKGSRGLGLRVFLNEEIIHFSEYMNYLFTY